MNLDNFLICSKNENIIIRHAELKDFINKTKTEKLKAVSSVIGFDVVPETRDLLTKVKNSLMNDQKYIQIIGSTNEKERDIYNITETISGPTKDIASAVFRTAEMMRERIGEGKEIKDIVSYKQWLESITSKTAFVSNQQSILYHQLHSQVSNIKVDYQLFQRFNSFADEVKTFIERRNNLEKLVLSHLYENGAQILVENPEINHCPLCGADIDNRQLLEHIQNELANIGETSRILDSYKQEASELLRAVNTFNAVISEAQSAIASSRLSGIDDWLKVSALINEFLASLVKRINFFLNKPCIVSSISENETLLFSTFQMENNKLIETIQSSIDDLDETSEENQKAITIVAMRNLFDYFQRWLSLSEQKRSYDLQISSLEKMIAALEQTEREKLNNVLNQISADVNDFYLRLHPNEGFDQLRLTSTQDRGLEFDFIFQGDPISPPGKLLSESHLNTLGLCFFLASVVHYNQQCEFVILDDIVSSVDANHRQALARLLRDNPKLNKRQYIILSHDKFWSDLLKQTFPNWIHKKIVNWSYDGGLCIDDVLSLREQVDLAFSNGNPIDAGHKVRNLAEIIFKDICESYDILMPYRQDSDNEKRKLKDFVEAVQKHFGSNNRFISNQPPLIDILNCLWLMNITSHPEPRQLNLTMNDIKIILDDLNKFEAFFYKHSSTCSLQQKKLKWDKKSKEFTPCPDCNEPL